MCSVLDPMAQDKIPEQDIGMQEQSLPQMNPKPEMGAAAAAKYDTSPPLLHQNPPPNPAETARPSALDIILQAKDAHTQAFINNMRALRGEMRQMGHGLQAGIMATPRAGSSELKGSAPAGEDRVIRETCWARRVEVTETVTGREKVNGVTETCTSETRREVTELTKTREIGEKPHGGDRVGAAHTHRGSEGQWG